MAGCDPFSAGVVFCHASAFVLAPVTMFVCSYFGVEIPEFQFDMDSLMTVLLGMLGLGGLRTVEKIKKLQNKVVVI